MKSSFLDKSSDGAHEYIITGRMVETHKRSVEEEVVLEYCPRCKSTGRKSLTALSSLRISPSTDSKTNSNTVDYLYGTR